MMRTEVIEEFHWRYEKIERCYLNALAGRDPLLVPVHELVATVRESVPDASMQEIATALRRWSVHLLDLIEGRASDKAPDKKVVALRRGASA